MATLEKKAHVLNDYKYYTSEEGQYITGYASVKNVEDAQGETFVGNTVYDLTRFRMNPVALVDHDDSVGSIFGVYIIGKDATEEDDIGLKVKLKLMDNPQTDLAKHAVETFKSGIARGFSVGGRWERDRHNRKLLTKAHIYEISGVAIPSNFVSLTDKPYVKSISQETELQTMHKVLEMLIGDYRKSSSNEVLSAILNLKEAINEIS